MWFWWFILICDCLIPAIMIIAGRMMWKHCPKKINGVVGYRTKMSMINMDTWRFAHDHAGKLWWKVGIGLLGPTMLIHIPFYGASDDTIGILSIIKHYYHCNTTGIFNRLYFPDGKVIKKQFQ